MHHQISFSYFKISKNSPESQQRNGTHPFGVKGGGKISIQNGSWVSVLRRETAGMRSVTERVGARVEPELIAREIFCSIVITR